MAIYAASQDPNNSDRTITVESDALESLSSELAIAVDKDNTTILPNDLRNTIDTVEVLLRFNTVSACTHIYQLSWHIMYNITRALKAAQYSDTLPKKTICILLVHCQIVFNW